MKIAIGFEIHDSDKTPILIQFSPQDRLDIISMPSDKNVLIMAPTGMKEQDIEKWAQNVMTSLDPKSAYVKISLCKKGEVKQ